jgi:hypothetical protein
MAHGVDLVLRAERAVEAAEVARQGQERVARLVQGRGVVFGQFERLG